MDKKKKTLLIITCSGGAGCIQAAKAKEQEARRLDPDIKVITKDVLRDWIWKFLGRFCENVWNRAQRRGKVRKLEAFLRLLKYADIVFAPIVFFASFSLLKRENVDRVIDAQPLCTSSLIRAIRLYNKLAKKKIIMEKVLVDLPTHNAAHFFAPFKSLSKKNRAHFQLITIPPLLENKETANEFWLKYCDLEEKEIIYEDYYIREAFRKFRDVNNSKKSIDITIATKSSEESRKIVNVMQKGSLPYTEEKNHLHLHISSQAIVVTILLGSQPAFDGTLKYVKDMLAIGKEATSNPIHIFVLCSHCQIGKRTLFNVLCEEIEKIENYPKHITVVPLSFQNESVVAQLFSRSNITCTKSGGQTSMELLAVMNGSIWIHSEAKFENPNKHSLQELLAGIPSWEAGNALYLQRKKGAHIVSPYSFHEHFKELLANTH